MHPCMDTYTNTFEHLTYFVCSPAVHYWDWVDCHDMLIHKGLILRLVFCRKKHFYSVIHLQQITPCMLPYIILIVFESNISNLQTQSIPNGHQSPTHPTPTWAKVNHRQAALNLTGSLIIMNICRYIVLTIHGIYIL